MELKFDSYSLKAEVLPVYLTLAPALLFVAGVVPEGFQLPLGGAVAVITVPISFLLSQIGADFGRVMQKQLWKNWGGPPTTRFLRHQNTEFNAVTRGRVHEKLRALGLHVPTCEEQDEDERGADEHFRSCTEELIRRTRNTNTFPLVFRELTNYGFRRNLLGLKRFGVAVAVTALLGGGGWSIYIFLATAGRPTAATLVGGLVTVGLILAWFVWVKEQAVFLAANQYARFLLEAALELEPVK